MCELAAIFVGPQCVKSSQSKMYPYRYSAICGCQLVWYVITSPDCTMVTSLRWRHNGRDGVSNQQPHDCLLNRLFVHRSKNTSKPRVTGLCAGNSPGTGEFPAQMASNTETVSIWWRHHVVAKNWSWAITGITFRQNWRNINMVILSLMDQNTC